MGGPGTHGELFDWLGALLERPLPEGRLGARASVAAVVLLFFDDPPRMPAFAKQARERAARVGDEHDRALAQYALGRAKSSCGDPVAGAEHLEAAAAQFHELGDDWHHALALQVLAYTCQDLEAALTYFARAAEAFGRVGDHVKQGDCLIDMARAVVHLPSRHDDAQSWVDQARRLAEKADNHHLWLHAETCQAFVNQRRGDSASAGLRFARLLPDFRRIGDRRCVARCLLGLGTSTMAAGDHDTARRHLAGCIEITGSTNQPAELAEAFACSPSSTTPSRGSGQPPSFSAPETPSPRPCPSQTATPSRPIATCEQRSSSRSVGPSSATPSRRAVAPPWCSSSGAEHRPNCRAGARGSGAYVPVGLGGAEIRFMRRGCIDG